MTFDRYRVGKHEGFYLVLDFEADAFPIVIAQCGTQEGAERIVAALTAFEEQDPKAASDEEHGQ
jgi:hypothetical protein